MRKRRTEAEKYHRPIEEYDEEKLNLLYDEWRRDFMLDMRDDIKREEKITNIWTGLITTICCIEVVATIITLILCAIKIIGQRIA